MRYIRRLSIVGVGLLLLSGACAQHQSNALITTPVSGTAVESAPAQSLYYTRHPLAQSVVHIVIIPPGSRFDVQPVVADEVDTVEGFARKQRAIAVLNAGFFDPQNAQTTSHIMVDGQVVADPRQNPRLVNNPDLAAYMAAILNRSELRRYRCADTIRYDITQHQAPIPSECQLIDAIGAGPQLLPEDTAVQEAFVDPANGRDALGSRSLNARTAVGTTSDGSLVWVMVAQIPENPTASGMTFSDLAAFMKTLGVEKALNLDGGSSSSLYYQGKAVYGKVDRNGDGVRRQVKSVLMVRDTSQPQ